MRSKYYIAISEDNKSIKVVNSKFKRSLGEKVILEEDKYKVVETFRTFKEAERTAFSDPDRIYNKYKY